MSELKLKPCPFCGGEAEIRKYVNGYNIWFCARCDSCKITQTSTTQTEQQAIAAWNRRANDGESY